MKWTHSTVLIFILFDSSFEQHIFPEKKHEQLTAILINKVLEEALPLIRRYLENEAQSSRRQFDEIKETFSTVKAELEITKRQIKELRALLEDLCGPCWAYHHGYCYRIIQTRATYEDARDWCQSRNAFVADVTSEKEYRFIKAELKKSGQKKYYLGGQLNRTSDEWIWYRTGEKFVFTKWHVEDGEPNDLNKDEDCLQMQGHRDFKWNDVSCTRNASFIFKKSAFGREDKTGTSP
ncbi:C-type lectin lectoxin-Phi1-like [Argopecten irradians]|uniref:C-type lectin lectoxin-Phi1-like n=1 Tax=Argopecten irradians TaxID=31199 RepID=UPI00370F9EBE